jgi:hypothetical protein
MADWNEIMRRAEETQKQQQFDEMKESWARNKADKEEVSNLDNTGNWAQGGTDSNSKQHAKNMAKHRGIYDAAIEMKVADLKRGWAESKEAFKARQEHVREIERNKQSDVKDFSRQDEYNQKTSDAAAREAHRYDETPFEDYD